MTTIKDTKLITTELEIIRLTQVIIALEMNDEIDIDLSLTKIDNACNDKTSWISREGALIAYTKLFNVLGQSFEPFVIKVLPNLLIMFVKQLH